MEEGEVAPPPRAMITWDSWDSLLLNNNDGAVGIMISRRRTAANANTAPPPAPSSRLLPRRRDGSTTIDRTERNDNIIRDDERFPKFFQAFIAHAAVFFYETSLPVDAVYHMYEQEAREGRLPLHRTNLHVVVEAPARRLERTTNKEERRNEDAKDSQQ